MSTRCLLWGCLSLCASSVDDTSKHVTPLPPQTFHWCFHCQSLPELLPVVVVQVVLRPFHLRFSLGPQAPVDGALEGGVGHPSQEVVVCGRGENVTLLSRIQRFYNICELSHLLLRSVLLPLQAFHCQTKNQSLTQTEAMNWIVSMWASGVNKKKLIDKEGTHTDRMFSILWEVMVEI